MALALSLVTLAATASASDSGPFRLDAELPDRLTLSVTQRARGEAHLDSFRDGSDDEVLLLRTLIDARVRLGKRVRFGIELQDSRALLDSEETPLGTSIVNAVEPLRLYVSVEGKARGGDWTLDAGRLTLDVGSRRFVARNRYRNTINSFAGVDGRWRGAEGGELRAFFLLPIRRRPADRAALDRNAVRLDDESTDVRFWGVFAGGGWGGRDRWELFVFGLDENDSSDRATPNRRLLTPGVRLSRPAASEQWDYTVEAALQFGDSRRSSSSAEDLDHDAFFHHLELGYTFGGGWRPRLLAQLDVASGDDDPDDRENNRFDTLYGARRFDYGPTGTYGPFARSNLSSLGLRLQLRPRDRLTSFVALRQFELESARDAWTTTGRTDPTGASGRSLGTQLESRVRYDLLPGNLQLEAGAAYLWSGSFARRVGESAGRDAFYAYLQTTWTF